LPRTSDIQVQRETRHREYFAVSLCGPRSNNALRLLVEIKLNQNQKFRLLPIQIVEEMDGIVLRRGVEQVLVPDANALLVMRVLQKALLTQPRSQSELLGLFAGPARPLVESLLELLRKKRFIVVSDMDDAGRPEIENEGATDIFYWHFNQTQARIARTLNEKTWVFVGVNLLTMHLLQAMLGEGLENYVIVDDPMLRNVALYDDAFELLPKFWRDQRSRIVDEDSVIESPGTDYGFVVAASEFGGAFLLERWNDYAVASGIAFYPVLLQNLIGYCGPLVIPSDSACFACLKTRQNSNVEGFHEKRLMERHAFHGQHAVAYHRSMLQVLANVAQFDLIKFKSNIRWEIGTLCEIDLLSGSMSRRKILKAPRCPVCSGLRAHPRTNIHKKLASAEAWSEVDRAVRCHEF
jgi:thiazole/oxazole-forming peptide maturase SagC family component